MALNTEFSKLLDLLACPHCTGELEHGDRGDLTCVRCGRAFPIRDGVPDIRTTSDAAITSGIVSRLQYAILGNPRVYNFQQAHFGAKPVVERLVRELAPVRDATVLDIGAGTGVVAELLPDDSSQYVWLDNDVQKLRGLVERRINCLATLGDADQLPLRDDAVDLTLMVEVSHHIPDAALGRCVDEAARVTRGTFLFVDAVRGSRLRSKLMWQLDLGRFPRPEAAIAEHLAERFSVNRTERFSGVNHDHVLFACVPREREATNYGRDGSSETTPSHSSR